MSDVNVEIFFDYSSPWTYLAFSQLEELFLRLEKVHNLIIKVDFKPVLVGGIFNKANPTVYEARKTFMKAPNKTIYGVNDLNEWSEMYNLKILGPYEADPSKRVSPFPVNSVKALRGALFFLNISLEKFFIYSKLIFESYWSHSNDISKDEVLKQVVESSSLNQDFKEFIKFITKQSTKDKIREFTDECINRGGFGSPTMFVNHNFMYFGNDRLILFERRILMEAFGKVDLVGCQVFKPTSKL